MKKGIAFALAGLLVLGLGCEIPGLTDDNDDDGGAQPTSIHDLTMGGIVLSAGDSAAANIFAITSFGEHTYSEATVYVNGHPLTNAGGWYQNNQAIMTQSLGDSIHVVVYALGDSAVYNFPVAKAPLIASPAVGAQPVVGDSLRIAIAYPGEHRLISMSLNNQPNVVAVLLDKPSNWPIDGKCYLANAGEGQLLALAATGTGTIPTGIDVNNPMSQKYEVFCMATYSTRTVNVAAAAKK